MLAMHQRNTISVQSMPSLPHHVHLRFDPVREAWALLSPERIYWPNDASLDILRRCDGTTTVGAIIQALALEYDAEEEELAADVIAFLQEWTDNLLVTP